jgi:ubiquinone/menaquinone biosynthesis C-methylase UbiE
MSEGHVINRCRNPVEHYEKDGNEFDYFELPDPIVADLWQRLRTAAVRFLNIHDGMKVLDVGSGSGWFSQSMQSKKVDVISVDLSFGNLKKVIENYNGEGCVAGATGLPLADRSVDAVIASEVIEHVNDPAKAVAEFLRVIKPGGRVIITTPYKEEIKQHLCIHCNNLTPANAHLHSFDEEKLIRYFSQGGANEIYYRRIGNKAFSFTRLSYLLRWLPFPVWSLIDRCANVIIKKPAHIIVCGIKQGAD